MPGPFLHRRERKCLHAFIHLRLLVFPSRNSAASTRPVRAAAALKKCFIIVPLSYDARTRR